MEISDTYLDRLTLDGLKLLAGQLVLDIDVSGVEDREDMIRILRSNSL